jgi:hypothetical protein
MSPRWGSTPRLTDWLTVSRNVTLTLSSVQFHMRWREWCDSFRRSISTRVTQRIGTRNTGESKGFMNNIYATCALADSCDVSRGTSSIHCLHLVCLWCPVQVKSLRLADRLSRESYQHFVRFGNFRINFEWEEARVPNTPRCEKSWSRWYISFSSVYTLCSPIRGSWLLAGTQRIATYRFGNCICFVSVERVGTPTLLGL